MNKKTSRAIKEVIDKLVELEAHCKAEELEMPESVKKSKQDLMDMMETPVHCAKCTQEATGAITTEELIQEKCLNAPRLNPGKIDAVIAKEEYHKLTDVLTVCVLTLVNGFTVTGESACASPENYDKMIGERIAKDTAREKIWPLMGFLLKDELNGNVCSAVINRGI